MKARATLALCLLAVGCGEASPEPLGEAPRGKPIAAAPTAERNVPAPAWRAQPEDLSPAERLARDGFEALRMSEEERAALALALEGHDRARLPLESFPERVRALDGASAVIRGWMIPGRMELRNVRDFMLVRDNQACCFGAMPTFDEWIHVEMEPDARAEYLRYVEVEVTGVLSIGGAAIEEGLEPPALRLRASRCRQVTERRRP